MSHKEEPVGAPGILDVIATLSAQRVSGRLDVVAGATEGAFLFTKGKLVDARLGHLSGFQAVNAVAAMAGARFHFDPTIPVPTSSSITPSERLVLKQFFGIETSESTRHSAAVVVDDVETTVVASNVSNAPTETISVHQAPSTAATYHAQPRVRSRIAAALVVLVIALAAAGVVLRYGFRDRGEPATVATTTESVPTPVPTQAVENEKSISAPRDLTGKWNVVNTVHTTSYKSFKNLQIGFALWIDQTGRTFTAKGEKVSENGVSLPASSRTPIQLKGFIDGDTIEATFYEEGATRKTNGRFVWKIDRAGGGLTGTFASTAAKASGKSTARRES